MARHRDHRRQVTLGLIDDLRARLSQAYHGLDGKAVLLQTADSWLQDLRCQEFQPGMLRLNPDDLPAFGIIDRTHRLEDPQ